MISLQRPIFGDENARLDTSLYKCSVPFPSQVHGQPILSGRWGVGKTAAFLLRHRELGRALREVGREYEYIWYLDEEGLDSDTLFSLKQHYGENISIFKRTLEELWNTEILRITARILSLLYEHYGSPSGTHWKAVRSIDFGDRYARPVWSHIADLIGAAGGDIGKAVAQAIGDIVGAFSNKFEEAVQDCLADIQSFETTPAVVIEPIDTPASVFEKADVNLSQLLLVSLLDLYTRKFSFSPKRNQYIRVEIAIPWHRSVRENLREPQKLPQYMGHISWERGLLRQFMVKRIENEFTTVKRQVRQRADTDAWDLLFTRSLRNNWSSCEEDSFSYILRHTHHRTRDLMRLARNAIHTQVDLSREAYPYINADQVLAGGPILEVSPTAIRSGVEEALKTSSEDRLTEAKRRYSEISDMVDILRGIESPFSHKTLASRAGSLSHSLGHIVEVLWECGIIGFEILPKTEQHVHIVEKNVGEKGISEFQTKYGVRFKKYFLFEYNCEPSVSQIERIYDSEISDRNIVVHPVFIENLGVRATRDYPIGV